MSPTFERIAREVSRRAAELLGAETYVLDAHETVVAASDLAFLGRRFEKAVSNDEPLVVPLRLVGADGAVVVGPSRSGEAMSPRLAQAVVELVIQQARLADELPGVRELKHRFIHDLLRAGPLDEETVLRQARILGMDLTPPRAVMLIDAREFILAGDPGDDGRAARRAQLVIGSVVGFFRLPSDTICGYIGEGEVAVLKASDTRSLQTWAGETEPGHPTWANLAALKRAGAALLARLHADTGSPVSLGLGRYHKGVDGLSRSYADARAALTLGCRLHGEGLVHSLDTLGAAAFVGVPDERTKADLARHLLSPLDVEPDLVATLSAYFDHDCQPIQTARVLGIHRNTLAYRLDKIHLLCGVDPRRFDHAVQMRLAMLLREMHERRAFVS